VRSFFRRYRRGLTLAEAPKLVEARTDRPFVVLGQTVVVHWEAEHARTVEVTAASRRVRVDGRPGHGSVPVLLDSPGFVEVRAVNDVGVDHRCLGPIAVVRKPAEQPLPVPMPQPEWPTFTTLPAALPPLPAVELPAVPFVPVPFMPTVPAGEPEIGSAPRWPALPSTRCPIDVLSLTTLGPRLDLGLEPEGGGT